MTSDLEQNGSEHKHLPEDGSSGEGASMELKTNKKHGYKNYFSPLSERGVKYTNKAKLLLNLAKKIPHVILENRMKMKESNYASLKLKLKQSRIPISHEMYISNAIFYSITSGIIGAIMGLIAAYTLIMKIGLPEQITKLTFSPSVAWLLQFKEIFIGLLIIVFLTALLGGITYLLFMIYPSIRAGERKGKIDSQLPYAVTFMYALSKGGMNIIEVFKLLAKSEDTYGEVSKEIGTVIREMDYFGHDLRTALKNVSEVTPSDRFQDLIYNLLTVIDTGGNIPKYFQDKSEQYLQQSIVDQKGFLDTLALLAESYVTAFVAGPLFIIIMGVMMAVMGSGTAMMVNAIIYAVLPIGSVMFVVLISIITPGELGEPPLLPTKEKLEHGAPDTPEYLEPIYDEEGELIDETEEKVHGRSQYEGFRKSKKNLKMKGILKNPLKPIFQKPILSMAITGPLAFILLIVAVIINIDSMRNPSLIVDALDDWLVFAIYIAIIPLTVFHEIKSRKVKKHEKNFPDFLKKLSSTNETGMTLRDSIKLMAKSDSGGLSDEIKKIWRDVKWGLEVNDSFIRFANRLRTQVVSRSLTLITKANESSGDIGEVLLVAARDAASEQEMKRERSMNMLIYVIIIYIAFLVFVGVIYVISTTFLAEMAAAGEKMAESGSQGGFLGSFDLEAYTRLFKHAAIIQGISSGLMAGAMGEGSVMSGLKHSIIMMTVGYLIFTLFI